MAKIRVSLASTSAAKAMGSRARRVPRSWALISSLTWSQANSRSQGVAEVSYFCGLAAFALLFHQLHDRGEVVAQWRPGVFVEVVDLLPKAQIAEAAVS
jgi:hypothetical protein